MSTVQSHVELKGIQTRLERARAELRVAEFDEKDATARVKHHKSQVVSLEEELKNFRDSHDQEIVVSEHALLRYLERVMGIDMNDVKSKILTPDVISAIRHFKGGLIPGQGFNVRVRNNVVTTLMVDDDEA